MKFGVMTKSPSGTPYMEWYNTRDEAGEVIRKFPRETSPTVFEIVAVHNYVEERKFTWKTVELSGKV